MKPLTPEKQKLVNEFLQQPLIARMATADQSGQPHVVPVWFGWDGTSIWISSFDNTRKITELMRNPKLSIAIDTSDENLISLAVVLEGSAELIREPRDFLRKQFTWIYQRYLGEDGVLAKDPQSWIEDSHNLLIKLTPTSIYTWEI